MARPSFRSDIPSVPSIVVHPMPFNFRPLVGNLLPRGGNLLFITDQGQMNEVEGWGEDFSVKRDTVRIDVKSPVAQNDFSKGTHYLPLGPIANESIDGVCFTRFPRQANKPLDLLNYVCSALRPGGYFVCNLPESDKDSLSSDRESEVGHLVVIASRLGLIALSPLELGLGNEESPPLVFRKLPVPPRWQLGHLDDPEFFDFSKLFRDAFALEPNPALWKWKFGSGRGRSVIATRHGRLIAHYGSTLRAVAYFGKPGLALQICDVMVDPHERGVMTKKGAMYIMTSTYLEIYLGLQDYTIAYGFPNRRHMQLGERLGLYAEVARMSEIRWRPFRSRPSPWSKLHLLEADSPIVRSMVNQAWRRMAKDLAGGIAIVRDWNYLKYRYLSHPINNYSIYAVVSRWTLRLAGIIVLRKDNETCELVDLISPLSKIPILVDQALRVAHRWGCETLYCWATDYHASRFDCQGGVITSLDISVPASLWPPGRETAHLRQKWWLMSGDTEFR